MSERMVKKRLDRRDKVATNYHSIKKEYIKEYDTELPMVESKLLARTRMYQSENCIFGGSRMRQLGNRRTAVVTK